MKLQVLSIYDSKSKIFSQPFYASNTAVGKRMFTDLVNDKTSNVARHPEDFSLHWLGEFDDELGKFEAIQPENLGLASQFKYQE